MIRIIVTSVLCIIWFLSWSHVSAAPVVCPVVPEMVDIYAEAEALWAQARSRYALCKSARDARNESSVTDFVCPSGDFNLDNRWHQDEILAYQLAFATVFERIDMASLQHAKALYCIRNNDPIAWQQSIKVFTDDRVGYAGQYLNTCSISYIIGLLNVDPNNTIIKTTDVLPQASCSDLARRKIDALHNLSLLIAAEGVSKSYENYKDTFINMLKSKYGELLDKFSYWIRLVDTAMHKLDKYLQETIR